MPEFCIKTNKKHLGVGYKGEQGLKEGQTKQKGTEKIYRKGKRRAEWFLPRPRAAL